MPAAYLLDTSVYSQPIRSHSIPGVLRKMEEIGDRNLRISIICELELFYGIYRRHSTRLRDIHARVLKDRFQILPVDEAVADMAARIKCEREASGKAIADFDLLIAATARAHHLILATLNTRHFQNIEGLAVEDWSK